MKSIQVKSWGIVNLTAIAIAIFITVVVFIHGFNEEAVRLTIRLTARTSCILFLVAFTASALHYFLGNQISRWIRANRRYLGVSMAVSHSFHALAIIALAILAPSPEYYSNHGGNLGYLFIFLMTITSFQKTASLLGDQGWKILHTVGIYYLWLAFTVTFADRLSESFLIYFPFVSLLVIALLIRLTAQYHHKFINHS